MMRRERWEMLARRDGIVMRTLGEWNALELSRDVAERSRNGWEIDAKRHADNADYWRDRCNTLHLAMRDASTRIGAYAQALATANDEAEKIRLVGAGIPALAVLRKSVHERIKELVDLRAEFRKLTFAD